MIWNVFRRRKFNCGDQDTLTWMQRAYVCADVLQELTNDLPSSITVADIGCGDQKLKAVFRERNLLINYHGFDLLPQAADVGQFDIRSDRLEVRPDVIVVLGVLEYLEDPVATLARLAEMAPRLIFSYVAKRPGEYSDGQTRKLNWIERLTEDELIASMPEANWRAQVRRTTPDTRTLVLGCETIKYFFD